MGHFANSEFTIWGTFTDLGKKNVVQSNFFLFFLFFVWWNGNNFVPLQSQNDKRSFSD